MFVEDRWFAKQRVSHDVFYLRTRVCVDNAAVRVVNPTMATLEDALRAIRNGEHEVVK